MPKRFRLTEMISRTGDLVYRYQGLQFSGYHAARGSSWEPSVNVYRCENQYEVCIDLAGVAKDNIQVSVFSDRLEVKGTREQPIPKEGSCCQQVLGMEIETGEFFRRIPLKEEVVRERVSARQENGLLWVTLPLAGSQQEGPEKS